MKYRKATINDLDKIYWLVQTSIEGTYPQCYPKEVVTFFTNIHSKSNIMEDIILHSVWIIEENEIIVGTGCRKDNHITRVYILPEYQRKGYGKMIMDLLEQEAAKEYATVYLDPSDLAVSFYEKRGYKTIKESVCQLDHGIEFAHNIMQKELKR